MPGTDDSSEMTDVHNTTLSADPMDTQMLTTPPMQRLDVEFQVGESIQYWSHTYELWMNAVVQQQNLDPETGTVVSYDLDVKSGAKPINMRRLSEDSGKTFQAGPQMTQQKQTSQFRVGQHVEYWSGTHAKWVCATVKAVYDGETYDLDVKRGALRRKIRPLSTHPAGSPLNAMSAFPNAATEMGTRSGFMPTVGELGMDIPEINGSEKVGEARQDGSLNTRMGLFAIESDTIQAPSDNNRDAPLGNRTMGLVPVEPNTTHGIAETRTMGPVPIENDTSLDRSKPLGGTDKSFPIPMLQAEQSQDQERQRVSVGNGGEVIDVAAETSQSSAEAYKDRRTHSSTATASLDKQATVPSAGELCNMVADMSVMIIKGDVPINQRWLMRFADLHRKYVELSKQLQLKDCGLEAKLEDLQIDFGLAWADTGIGLPGRVDRIDEKVEESVRHSQ